MIHPPGRYAPPTRLAWVENTSNLGSGAVWPLERVLAEGLAEIPGLGIDPRMVETNLVFFDVAALGMTAVEWCAIILEQGVRMNAMGRTRVRAVTHLDVDRASIDRALVAARAVAEAHR